jgi:hypothetical protein
MKREIRHGEVTVTVMDEPGAGGAHHHYMVTLPDWSRNPDGSDPHGVWDIQFQKGPTKEAGVNGLTCEVLLAIVIDRLRCFQAGPVACKENAIALGYAVQSLDWLNVRTRDRKRRGVEGTTTK